MRRLLRGFDAGARSHGYRSWENLLAIVELGVTAEFILGTNAILCFENFWDFKVALLHRGQGLEIKNGTVFNLATLVAAFLDGLLEDVGFPTRNEVRMVAEA